VLVVAEGVAFGASDGVTPGVRALQTIMEILSHPAVVLGIITSFAGLAFGGYRRHGHKYVSAASGTSANGV
jgi:hypothetical protein